MTDAECVDMCKLFIAKENKVRKTTVISNELLGDTELGFRTRGRASIFTPTPRHDFPPDAKEVVLNINMATRKFLVRWYTPKLYCSRTQIAL